MRRLDKRIFVLLGVGILLYAIFVRRSSPLFEWFNDDYPYISGFYNWTWNMGKCVNGGGNPSGKYNIGILFGGEQADDAITNHLNDSSKLKNCDEKYLDLGGGNNKGGWSVEIINAIYPNLTKLKSNGWDGLCFDIEVCVPACDTSGSLSAEFSKCFAACKQAGLKVFVTTNMSGPYDASCNNCRNDIFNMIMANPNIDYVSPQLYGASGDSLPPNLTSNSLDAFTPLGRKVLLSIPKIFKNYGSCPDQDDWSTVKALFPWVGGYILWMHDSDSPPSGGGVCGTSASTVNCSVKCPSGTDGDCPTGQKCYANVPKCETNWCGTSWGDADQNCNKTANNKPCPSGTDSDCPANYKCWSAITCKNFN